MEKEKVQYSKIPDVFGKREDDARDYLAKRKVKVKKKAIKKFNLAYRSGTVIKTEPPIGTKIKENETIKLYVAENRVFTMFLVLVVILLSIIATYGYKLSYVMINTQGPFIKSDYNGFVKTNIVRVATVSEMESFTNYQYCLTTSSTYDSCVWNNIETDFVTVSDSGKWYVYFRAYNRKNGKYSLPSNRVQVLIDRSGPELRTSFVKNKDKISFEVATKDDLSGVKSISYSLDGVTYKETYEKFEINSYNVSKVFIKVIDQLDNETIKEVTV